MDKHQIQDLQVLIDASLPAFHWEAESGETSFRIQRIEKETLVLQIPVEIKLPKKMKGFVIGKNGKSLYELPIESHQVLETTASHQVISAKIQMGQIQTYNRRNYFRARFKSFQKAALKNRYFPEGLGVLVADLSGGGLRFSSEKPLKVKDRFAIVFDPQLGAVTHHFEFHIEIVSELSALDKDHPYTYGARILPPRSPNAQEIRKHDELEKALIRFCNDYAIHHLKLFTEVKETSKEMAP